MGYLPPQDDGPLQRVLAVLSIACGATVGMVVGFFGFCLATSFAAMLRYALPSMSSAAFVAVWCVALAVPIFSFTRMARRGLPSGRAFGACALVALVLLFAGEITGTHPVYPWHTHFYITPGPFTPASDYGN